MGYQNGQVVVWDLTTLSIVKALPDIHKAAVVHVRFLNEYSQLISGDVKGMLQPPLPHASPILTGMQVRCTRQRSPTV